MIQLYRPIRTGRITQVFGQNLVPFYKQAGLKGHQGIDTSSFVGQPVYFNCTSDINTEWRINSYEHPSAGIMVVIWSVDPVLYDKRVKLRFMHLSKAIVCVQKTVVPGQLIGYTGNTGSASTGPHLHWDVGYATEKGAGRDFDNGYGGCFNPAKFYKDEFVFDAQFTMLENMKADLHRLKEMVGLA